MSIVKIQCNTRLHALDGSQQIDIGLRDTLLLFLPNRNELNVPFRQETTANYIRAALRLRSNHGD